MSTGTECCDACFNECAAEYDKLRARVADLERWNDRVAELAQAVLEDPSRYVPRNRLFHALRERRTASVCAVCVVCGHRHRGSEACGTGPAYEPRPSEASPEWTTNDDLNAHAMQRPNEAKKDPLDPGPLECQHEGCAGKVTKFYITCDEHDPQR